MDRIDLFPASRALAPQLVPDMRPTADAAAIARDTRPHVPLAVAAVPGTSLSQTAEVTRSLLRADTAATTDPSLPLDKRIEQVQRTLKPYGVSMLPDSQSAQRAKAAEARARTAEAAATTARAEADDAQAGETVKAREADRADATQAARPRADAGAENGSGEVADPALARETPEPDQEDDAA